MNTKVQTAIKGSAIALAMLLATGCTGMQNDIDALKTRVDLLEQEVAAANAAAANSASALAFRRLCRSACSMMEVSFSSSPSVS